MSEITRKFLLVKHSIAGDREEKHYEDNFALPRQEASEINGPSKMNYRLIYELEFAVKLTIHLKGKYDGIVEKAEDYIIDRLEKNGALTDGDCLECEKILAPMGKEAKEYKLIMAGHAHIDMNWMWSWQETVAITIATFRTMLKIMDEYPDFCFSQSQTSVYKIIDDYAPELKPEIMKHIKEGRWEVTSSAWVETDKNMPNTESLLKHIQYSKEYLRDKWEIDPSSLEVDFSPDTFGHSANIPEIDSLGNVKYYYHCRGLKGDNVLYRWKAKSGAEMLAYREQYWYNSGIYPKIGPGIIEISEKCAGLKTGLVVYGVGDHGGGPTRRDIESAHEMMNWPIFPTMKFGTFREFFHEAESVKDKLPLVDNELNFIFTGCYTTQSRIKRENRHSEALLNDAENIGALSLVKTGRAPKTETLTSAWQNVLFTHFHDILTGSCVQDSREHAMGIFSDAIAKGNTEFDFASRAIADNIDTSKYENANIPSTSRALGGGVGFDANNSSAKPNVETSIGGITRVFTFFNSSAVSKKECVELTVWDWEGDKRRIRFTDENGNDLPFQVIESDGYYWAHYYFRVLVYVNISPIGYKTVILSESECPDTLPSYYQPTIWTENPTDNYVLENDYIRAEFRFTDGALISLKDKANGEEHLKENSVGSFVCIDTEYSSSDAWHIGKYLKFTPVLDAKNVHYMYTGALRSAFTAEYVILGSKLNVNYSLDKDSKALRIDARIDWNEKTGATAPVLVYSLPLVWAPDQYIYNVPGGFVKRKPQELDVPALSWAASCDNSKSVAIITDSKYGFRGRPDGTLASTLINTSNRPDPYPERGIHNITLYVGIFDNDPYKIECEALNLLRKAGTIATGAHKGTLPLSSSLFDYDTDNVVISSVTGRKEDNSIRIRVYPMSEKNGKINFRFAENVSDAYAEDLMGAKLPADISKTKNGVSLKVPMGKIIDLRIVF